MNVAIIPARGGSKRIPGKNIRDFGGRPMIAWPIRAALESGLFARVIVSTDSDEIAEVAGKWGAETPFKRPARLADDHTPTAPVIDHALGWLRERGAKIEYACCIYATAPFLKAEYLREGYEKIRRGGAATVFSVCTFPSSIYRAFTMDETGRVSMIFPEYELTRSNDLPEAYHDAGQFYWLEAARFQKDPRLYGPDAMPVVLPRYLVQDIDTEEDWLAAEALLAAGSGVEKTRELMKAG